MYIVELECGVWLANGQGDPARTCDKSHAARFTLKQQAMRAMNAAKSFRPFFNATLEYVDQRI